MTQEEKKEPNTVGLTTENHQWLKTFHEKKIFLEMLDGYRFAIAYALNKGIEPPEISSGKKTIWNVGTFDPNGEMYNAIVALNPDLEPPIYKYAERLADWGMVELVKMYENKNRLDLVEILSESSEL